MGAKSQDVNHFGSFKQPSTTADRAFQLTEDQGVDRLAKEADARAHRGEAPRIVDHPVEPVE